MEPLLDGPGGGPEELRAIVARASRRRWRLAAGASALALAAGGGIGYAAAGQGGGTRTVVAGASPSPGRPDTALVPAASGQVSTLAGPIVGGLKLTRSLTRTVGNVTVRGYQVAAPAVAPQACGVPFIGPSFQAEISNPDMVATVGAGTAGSSSGPLESVISQVVGSQEASPVDVVIVHSSAAVSQVRAVFAGGGADQMAPISGWSVLVGTLGSATKGSAVTVTALGPTGQVVASEASPEGTVNGALGQPAVISNAGPAVVPACPICPRPPIQPGTKPPAAGTNPANATTPPTTGPPHDAYPPVSQGNGAVSGSPGSAGVSGGSVGSSGTGYACPVYGGGISGSVPGPASGAGSAGAGQVPPGATTPATTPNNG